MDTDISKDEADALLQEEQTFLTPHLPKIEAVFKLLESQLATFFTEATSTPTSVLLDEVLLSNKEAFITKVQDNSFFCTTANFSGDIEGNNLYVMPLSVATKVASKIAGEALEGLDEMAIAGLQAIFVRVADATKEAVATNTGKKINVDNTLSILNDNGLADVGPTDFVVVSYNLSYDDEELAFYELIDESFIKAMISDNVNTTNEKADDVSIDSVDDSQTSDVDMNSDISGDEASSTSTDVKPKPAYMDKPVEVSTGSKNSSVRVIVPSVQGVQLPNLVGGNVKGESRNISLLMDVMMELTVELGRTRWQIKEILGIGEGTIIELDKLAGEPVDILVNHNLIARGEVVIIDENFGVRVTEIVSGMDKIADKV